jgi:hypothetical protein
LKTGQVNDSKQKRYPFEHDSSLNSALILMDTKVLRPPRLPCLGVT